MAAAVQTYFEDFHRAIRLDEDDENAKLREKRDTLLKDLFNRLPEGMPSFESFHQGSYSMRTGTVPLDGNYDIRHHLRLQKRQISRPGWFKEKSS